MGFWDFIWLLIWSYFFVAYLVALFHVVADVFRDGELGGGMKAVWVIVLLFLPFLGVLIYLIVRGKGMASRQAGAAQQARAQTDQYIQSVAAQANPAEQVASAKALLDSGTINQAEFERLKAKALA